MRESEIVSVNAVRYDVDRFEAMPYDLTTKHPGTSCLTLLLMKDRLDRIDFSN